MLATHNVQLVLTVVLAKLASLVIYFQRIRKIAYVREKILFQVLAKIKPYFQLVLLFVSINLPLPAHRIIPGILKFR